MATMSNPKISPMMRKLDFLLENTRGATQKDLAAKLMIDQPRISKWINKGEGEPTAYQGKVIADYFKVDMNWLMDDKAPDDRPVYLDDRPFMTTEVERELIRFMRRLCQGDPELKKAHARLYLDGYVKEKPISDPVPTGEVYEPKVPPRDRPGLGGKTGGQGG